MLITQVSRIVFLSSFDRFTNFTTVRGKNFKNLINPWFQCTKYHQSSSQLIWLFYGFLQLYEKKL